MVTIKVCSQSSGNEIKGARVALHFGGNWTGTKTDTEYTDSNGEAHFDVSSGTGDVFVNGNCAHSGNLSGRVIVYV